MLAAGKAKGYRAPYTSADNIGRGSLEHQVM